MPRARKPQVPRPAHNSHSTCAGLRENLVVAGDNVPDRKHISWFFGWNHSGEMIVGHRLKASAINLAAALIFMLSGVTHSCSQIGAKA